MLRQEADALPPETLLRELERTGGRYGLQAMCEGGGQANVTVLERR